jgi:hypothetical protein
LRNSGLVALEHQDHDTVALEYCGYNAGVGGRCYTEEPDARQTSPVLSSVRELGDPFLNGLLHIAASGTIHPDRLAGPQREREHGF